MRLAVLLLLVLATPVSAQIKPTGTFALTACEARPAWVSFALLPDWADFDEAARCQRETGLSWVLALYGVSRYEPVGPYARAVKARADAAGLRFLAVVYHEEWYEHAFTPGALPIGALDPAHPVDAVSIVTLVHWWVGQQHATLATVFPGVPRVWLTGLVNDDRRHGPALWRPVPAGTDAIALEAYVPCGLTWDQTAGLYIRHALATRREPIVLVAQAFEAPGDPLWGCGPAAAVDGFASALRQPGVWGAWLFDWKVRPGIVGLSGLPQWRAAFDAALGVK